MQLKTLVQYQQNLTGSFRKNSGYKAAALLAEAAARSSQALKTH